MANPVMNTYVQVGKKEDVSDVISTIVPTNTPFVSSVGSEPVHNTVYSWMEDGLDAPGVNAQVEGAPAPLANQTPVVSRVNTTQIFAKTVSTTGTADAVELYGKPNREFARQLLKKGKEIKRDLEYACVGTRQIKNLGSTTVARQFDGVQAMIDPSVTYDIRGVNGVSNTGGSAAAISEAAILGAQQMAYATGGEPDLLLIRPSDSVAIANFAAATGRQRQLDADEKKITAVVNFYSTPFGDLKIVMDRWLAAGDALLLDTSMWKLRPLRAWFTKQLAETGDSRASELIGEYGLSHSNFLADARIVGLNSL